LDWRARLAAAESAWSLALLERDPDIAQEATRLFRKAAELDPRASWKWERLAAAHIQAGQSEAALAPLGKSLAIIGDIPRSANSLILRGMAYRELGQTDRALRDFDQVIRLNPSLADAYSNRGATYNNLGQYRRAIQDLDEAIRLRPEHYMAYNNRGNAYGNLDQVTRAIQDFNEAIRLDPTLALAYYNRALAYILLGGDLEAERDAERAVQLGFDSVPLRQAIARLKEDR
jgi:tetratricopeptide (TPR) repeat protein